MGASKRASMHHTTALSNRDPILHKLREVLAGRALRRALEVASGTGAHLELFATAFPECIWQPTEYVTERVKKEDPFEDSGKIGDIRSDNALDVLDANLLPRFSNVLKARGLDLTHPDQYSVLERFDLIHAGNVLHIADYPAATEGLFTFAGAHLNDAGLCTVYGPFKREGAFTTQSNQEFDAYLRGKNPAFGLRDVETEIVPVAKRFNLQLLGAHPMPANNFLLVFGKQTTSRV